MNIKIVNVDWFNVPSPVWISSGSMKPKFNDIVYTYEFKKGINFLPGAYQDGHWGLPYILTQKLFKCKYETGVYYYTKKHEIMLWAESLLINGKNVDFTEVNKKFFYVTMDTFNSRQLYKSTLAAEMKKECKKSGVEYKYLENIFSQPNDRFYDKLTTCHHVYYYYVTAFGFSKGYKIFCYPWFSKYALRHTSEGMQMLHKIFVENDLTAIIPVEDNIFEKSNILECNGEKEVFDFDYNVCLSK